jgi:hypothetical protein
MKENVFMKYQGGSLLEVDTAFDIAEGLTYLSKEDLVNTGELLVKTFKMLSKMIDQTNAI